jgi:hypothetical protein
LPRGESSANFAFTQNGESVAHGVILGREAEDGGVEITQPTVAQRCFTLDQVFDLAHVQLGLRNRGEHAERVKLIGGNFVSGEDFRTAEELSLEVRNPSF